MKATIREVPREADGRREIATNPALRELFPLSAYFASMWEHYEAGTERKPVGVSLEALFGVMATVAARSDEELLASLPNGAIRTGFGRLT